MSPDYTTAIEPLPPRWVRRGREYFFIVLFFWFGEIIVWLLSLPPSPPVPELHIDPETQALQEMECR
jgi:hypothetical protein